MREKYGLIGLLLTFGSQTIVSFFFFAFWHYIFINMADTVQRGFGTDPNSLSSSSSACSFYLASESRLRSLIAGQNAESAILIASLREVIRNQTQKIEALEKRIKELSAGGEEVMKVVHLFSYSRFLIWDVTAD
jgi:hypothetical protein